jgi:hypothetical protein
MRSKSVVLATAAAVWCMIFVGGCKTAPSIPLSDGDIPYILAPGTYTDKSGKEHVETKDRWVVSMSEGDLLRYIEWLRE